MKGIAVILSLVCLFAVAFQRAVSTQKPAGVAGKWDVTIRMPDRSVSEQWTIQQKGSAITATALVGRGMSFPVAIAYSTVGYSRITRVFEGNTTGVFAYLDNTITNCDIRGNADRGGNSVITCALTIPETLATSTASVAA